MLGNVLRFATLALASLALVATPVFATGCGGGGEEEEEFDFDGDDMRAAVEGTWSGTVTRTDGTVLTMTLTLDYVAPEKTPACGNRELGSAGERPRIQPQCVTESRIELAGEMTIEGGELSSAKVEASYYVTGNVLSDGYLEGEVTQPNPPPDETVLTLHTGGPLEGEHLKLQVGDDEDMSFVLSRQ